MDPAYAPVTGTPEVKGFTSREAQRLVRGLAGVGLVGVHIAEVALPYDDPGHITSLLPANLIFEFFSAIALS